MLDELASLRASGLLIGLSVTGHRQAETIERAVERDAFDVVQATWNLLERSAAPALAAAHAVGMGVIVKEALANGRLTTRGAIPQFAAAAARVGTTPDALALAAVLAQPWADVVLSGAATPIAIHSNLRGLTLDLSNDRLEELDSLQETATQYWRSRAELPWN